MIGETLSHYEIVEKIGAGGMGEVYRARDPRLGRDVAIKVLPSAFAQHADRLQRFEKEARAVGALDHPNVLAVHDVGSERGVPFLVTELLEGESLRDRIVRGRLTTRKAVEYAAQIADGLAAAHARRIVHRDLKPENVFITRSGHVKILDFGLAKLIEHRPSAAITTQSPTEALTAADVVVGTPGYMSPEQLHGDPVDHRADIFSFGVMLYEMLSGRRPFAGDSVAEVSASILRDEPAPLSDASQAVPPTLDRLVRQCLEKHPDERFESAHDLAHVLRAVSETSEVTAIPRKSAPRGLNLKKIALAAAVAIAAVAGWEIVRRTPRAELPEMLHVAVLPFEAKGDDPDGPFLAAGLTEVVADGLNLQERETRGAMWMVPPFPGLTLEEARTKHNATIAVLGVLTPDAERIRLDLELVDPASGQTLVRRSLDEDTRNLSAVQREPVRLVWEMLGFSPTPAALEDLEAGSTNTVTACRAYLTGRGRLSMADDEAELQAAVATLERATGEDPGYVPARHALAQACGRLFEVTRDARWQDRAVAEVERSLALDEDAAEPYLVLAEVYRAAGQRELELDAHRSAAARSKTGRPFYLLGMAATNAGEVEEAERALQTAINLRPGCIQPLNALAYLYSTMGRFEAAANQYRHAARAAPENQKARINLGATLYYLDRRDEAIEAFEDALAFGPHPHICYNLGTLYFEDGRFGDAVEMFEHAVGLAGEEVPADQYHLVAGVASSLYWCGERESAEPHYRQAIRLAEALLEEDSDNRDAMVDLAGFYGVVGEPDRGIELLEAVIRHPGDDPYFVGAIAESYADLGLHDRAVEWIGAAIDRGLDLRWLERRPSFNILREDDRYRELVQQSGNRG